MVDNDFLAIPTHPRMPPATTTTAATLSLAAAAHPSTSASAAPPTPSYPPTSIHIHSHTTPKSLARPHARAPKRYPCKFAGCDKDFSTSGHLSRHSRIHMGLKRFSCSVDGCDRTFVRADNRDQHDKSHRRRLCSSSNDSCESDHAPPSSPEASLVSAHSIEADSCPSPVSPSSSSSMQFIHSMGHVSKASISFLID
ncbi:hypothetical protein CcCBS67573_g08633 [Chytriomyces confervae]|uniref:C2H2-type domain-containing protein n=1 Tax=Chytriomyces confervae TaxID=246404 RepID=A0A507EIB1_9FUNG|nr:hypothetical protein CcCBS67573_g08633 [Chytriomyces confervae]